MLTFTVAPELASGLEGHVIPDYPAQVSALILRRFKVRLYSYADPVVIPGMGQQHPVYHGHTLLGYLNKLPEPDSGYNTPTDKRFAIHYGIVYALAQKHQFDFTLVAETNTNWLVQLTHVLYDDYFSLPYSLSQVLEGAIAHLMQYEADDENTQL